MLISNISGSPDSSQVDSYSVKRKERQALIQLAKALAAGDVTKAQKAFSTLQLLSANSGERASSPNSAVKPVQQDLEDLRTALTSGNLREVQSAFVKLNRDLRASSVNGLSGRIQGAIRSHHRDRQIDADTTTDTDAATPLAPNTGTEVSYTAQGSTADVAPRSFGASIKIYA